MKTIFTIISGLLFLIGYSQTKTMSYESNGSDSLMTRNPFLKFIGEWTLKDNQWTQNWGEATETLKIPGHHPLAMAINTKNSLLQIIDGPQPNGHALWSYNPNSQIITHLSSFGEIRIGKGEGAFDKNGNITLKSFFEGEAKDTYRIYHYTWVDSDTYHLNSVQFDANNKPTGLFYEGTFVRLPDREVTIKTQIEAILSVLDNTKISVEQQLEVYADDIVHMAPGHKLNVGKKALVNFLRNQREQGEAKMKHEILEIEQQGNIVIMRGKVNGIYYPRNESLPIKFRTKNLFVFDSKEGALKIKKIIYNSSPNK